MHSILKSSPLSPLDTLAGVPLHMSGSAGVSPLACQTRGSGSTVLCLHSSAGTGGQWRALAEVLSERWRVVAPDLHGHGHSPAWPAGVLASLHVDGVAALAACGSGPLHLVGHSYGAAVALQIALNQPERVQSLTLYEPVAFGLLGAGDGDAREEIEDVARSVARLVAAGELLDAARVFVGYWGGSRGWAQLEQSRRTALMQRMPAVPRHFEALFGACWSTEQLRRLRMPVLLMRGSATREPALRAFEQLARALPHAQCAVLPGAGHLGPMTHARTVAHWMTAHVDPLLAHRFDAPPAPRAVRVAAG